MKSATKDIASTYKNLTVLDFKVQRNVLPNTSQLYIIKCCYRIQTDFFYDKTGEGRNNIWEKGLNLKSLIFKETFVHVICIFIISLKNMNTMYTVTILTGIVTL
jgi:hypothetical protein